MITICALCKKEMRTATTMDRFLSSLDEEVLCSHGICYECGVKLYGAEMMAAVCSKMNVDTAGAGQQRRAKRNSDM
jgi:hypothetical protein